jgi:DNA-binding GntR family transcriptional regulator
MTVQILTRGEPMPVSDTITRRPSPVLDRRAPAPLYFQLRQAFLEEIRERGLEPGDRLPTEADLERRYAVSRATIRQALNHLAADGSIERIQGKGTFVGRLKIRHDPLLTSFSELLQSQGYTPSHRVIESEVRRPSGEAAAALGLDKRAECRYLKRILIADGKPVGVAETWIPRALLGSYDALLEPGRLEEGSLYELLENPPVGLRLHRAVETISPGLTDGDAASLLGCEPGSPVLAITRVTFDPDERVVEFTRLLFSGERYEYRVEMTRPGGAGGPR